MIIPQPNNRGGTGDIRISHAPLFLRKGGTLHDKFLAEAPDATASEGTKLALEEVRDRAFRALGLVDEYLRVRENGKAIGRMTKDEHSDDEVIEALLFGDETAPAFSGLSKEVELECLAQEIRKILSDQQVRETFLTELSAESARYETARAKLRTVSRMEAADDLAVKRMVQTYLKSKRHYGKLVQSSADEIAKLESARSHAAQRASAERKSANETERGFLKAQRLLAYKEQIRSKGFALTPSRKALIRKISEHVLSGRKVFLVGSTGTGKTELAFYVADVVSGGYEIVSWHEGTTPRDLFGYRELSTDAHGNTTSGTKPGPVTKAVTDGVTVIQDEYTAGTTRSQLAAKAFMNAKPGQKVHIPGFNGDVFEVSESFAEIFTGNPKDEKTKAREDMDPAILRMLTGLRIDYMPASEMEDVVLSGIVEDSWVLRLDPGEIELISKLCHAAELMHLFHNREFSEVEGKLPDDGSDLATLAKPFGDIRDSRLDKNFLDPGTLFLLFSDFDFTRAKRGDLRSHLERRLADFINDPKFDPVPEERELASIILHVCGVTESEDSKESVRVVIAMHEGDKGYLLPSELAKDTRIIRDFADPFAEEGETGDEAEIGNGKNETAPESREAFDSEKEFERISEGRYYSPEVIDKILLEFSGGTVRLSKTEIARLRANIPKKLTKAQVVAIENLKNKTEDGVPPIIMQVPATFLVDGHEVPFTLGKLKAVWDEAKDADRVPHGMFLGSFVTDTSKNKTWTDWVPRAYTSKCLTGSKSLSYDKQCEHAKSILGPNHEVDESMFVVMLFRYLASGKSDRLMLSDYMRLTSDKARDSDGDPLRVYSDDDALRLRSSRRDAHSDGGVGASLGISS